MAKCGVTNIGGGGGIGSDEVSAAKENVLSGKTYVGVDTGDEIGTGTMANNGATGNQSLNAGSSFMIKKGYHAQDFSVGANSLASQTSGTASAGQILSGQTAWVNGNKVTGSIPLQSGDASSDQVWSTNRTTWGDGNLFFGVRNGHYLNGVNWIRSYDAAFIPANIKKGANVFGVVGTWEGYVPAPNDLYYRGNNIAGFTFGSSGKRSFESGGIRIAGDTVELVDPGAINFNAYNYINAEIYYETLTLKRPTANLSMAFIVRNSAGQLIAQSNSAELSNNVSRTISINLSNISLTTAPRIKFVIEGQYYYDGNDGKYWTSINYGSWSGWIYRIWLS
ncbi:hypothetical protein [Lacrimispora amygdalina]|uniref:hypothetical protein n=1 Tax=Lacrimispora amygdalina TaxID=253257 RepID=UPI000BE3758D|nr:hypothetical protein [Lacrimispora amygdalina]